MITTDLREMPLSGAGNSGGLTTRLHPRIIGGVCEYCGVLDSNVEGKYQYKLCKHYKDREMKCSFCKESADHDDVIRQSTLLVKDDPYNPGFLVTLCGRFDCTRKFEEKYHIKAVDRARLE